MSVAPTPIEVWGPAFHFLSLDEITAEKQVVPTGDWRLEGRYWCRLCQALVDPADRESHAREHRRELAEFRRHAAGAARRAATKRLREINRLRAETRTAA